MKKALGTTQIMFKFSYLCYQTAALIRYFFVPHSTCIYIRPNADHEYINVIALQRRHVLQKKNTKKQQQLKQTALGALLCTVAQR